nr:hypothetical protein [Tanacetum cinerariifolium]
MTSTIVCQGLLTCLEPQVIETFVIQQTLTPPPPTTTTKIHDTNINRGWSFLKALENPTMHEKNDVQNDHVYVHPMTKRSSGSDTTVKVNHHRENGRLVIKAVSFSNCGTNFQADRSNGRLKLSLLRDSCVNYESEGGEIENYEKSDELDSSGDEVEDDVVVKNDDAEEEGGRSDGWRWESDGNRWTIAGKVTRCKEGGNENKVFANWRSSSWVAIS